LIFKGIDTYSEVYLNKKLLGKTINAFLKYEYEVKEHLVAGNNYLEVHIKSTKSHDNAGQQTDRMPFDYAHTRKACYQYSWDWAPYMNTLGIWLPVEMNFFD
jgi:beta-mannosidase